MTAVDEEESRYRVAETAYRLGGKAFPAGIAEPGPGHLTHAIAIPMHDDMTLRALEKWVVRRRVMAADPTSSSHQTIRTCTRVHDSFLVDWLTQEGS